MIQQNSGIPAWKKGLIAVLILADAALLIAGVITIPPHFRGAKAASSPTESVLPVLPDTDEPQGSEPEQAAPAVPSELMASEPPAGEVAFSTHERPSLEDFAWYTESVLYDGVPAGATAIDQFEEATGGWKALIIYDPENTHDATGMEFLNISIAGTKAQTELTLDWYLIFWLGEGESLDESEMEDTVFTGKWENSGLWASGAGTIRLTDLYGMNGKQYAIGTMDTPEGIPAYIALVRP